MLASRRFGRYLSADWRGRPQLDAAKVKAAEKFDGKFVVISNTLRAGAADAARRRGSLRASLGTDRPCARHVEGGALPLRGPGYCVQRTKVAAELAAMLKTLGISVPKQILAVEEPSQAATAA